MFLKLSPSARAQAQLAVERIAVALAHHDSASPLEHDGIAIRELMPVLNEYGRLFHEIVLGEIAAVEAAGHAALTPLLADADARRHVVAQFDFIRRFQHLRDGFQAGPHNASALLHSALPLLREALKPTQPTP